MIMKNRSGFALLKSHIDTSLKKQLACKITSCHDGIFLLKPTKPIANINAACTNVKAKEIAFR